MEFKVTFSGRFERIKFGIPVLDDALTAGVSRGTTLLFIGPPGVGKSLFIYYAIKNFLERGELVLIVSFDDDPNAVLYSLSSIGVDVEKYVKNKQLLIIDGFYHPLKPKGESKTPGVVASIQPTNPIEALEKVGVILEELNFKNGKGLFVVDSLNEVMLRSEITVPLDFVKALRAEVKSRGMIAIVSIHTGMEGAENLLFALEYSSDGVIEFGFDPNLENIGIPLRRLKVKKLRGTPHVLTWVPYSITDEGITPVNMAELANRLRNIITQMRKEIEQ